MQLFAVWILFQTRTVSSIVTHFVTLPYLAECSRSDPVSSACSNRFFAHAGTNGSALFIFTDLARTETYDVRIEATFGSETRILENSVRSGISVLL